MTWVIGSAVLLLVFAAGLVTGLKLQRRRMWQARLYLEEQRDLLSLDRRAFDVQRQIVGHAAVAMTQMRRPA